MLKSPKTTIWGIIIAVGTALANLNIGGELQWLYWVGQILIAFGSLMLGVSAKDS
jgi:hypothetical protein